VEQLEPRLLLSGPGNEQAIQSFGALPPVFAENAGQWADPSVRYAFSGSGASVAFTPTQILLGLSSGGESPDRAGSPLEASSQTTESSGRQSTVLRVRFEGANAVVPTGIDKQEVVFNYDVGDPSAWRQGIATYAAVAYAGLYDKIDLRVSSDRSLLKYQFSLAPQAHWDQIGITYEGAESLSIDSSGNLVIQTAIGDLVDKAPVAWQEIAGQRVDVAARFRLLDSDTVGFAIDGPYDPNCPLLIDPDIAWSAYLGGAQNDYCNAVAVDADGNVLVTGSTQSTGWIPGGSDATFNGQNSYPFVANPTFAEWGVG
jgi:hypothetical protein